jgi:hypothetical protein
MIFDVVDIAGVVATHGIALAPSKGDDPIDALAVVTGTSDHLSGRESLRHRSAVRLFWRGVDEGSLNEH